MSRVRRDAVKRDTGHIPRPAVYTGNRRTVTAVASVRKYVEERPLTPEREFTEKEISVRTKEVAKRRRERERSEAAKPQEQREAEMEEERVRAKEFNNLVGWSDENLDFDYLAESSTAVKGRSAGTRAHFEPMRACLGRM